MFLHHNCQYDDLGEGPLFLAVFVLTPRTREVLLINAQGVLCLVCVSISISVERGRSSVGGPNLLPTSLVQNSRRNRSVEKKRT